MTQGSSSPLLEVEDLKVSFDTPAGVVSAVNGVSFVLDGGETLGVVGESGSGKSVMSRALMNMLPLRNAHCQGQVTFDGRDMLSLPPQQLQHVLGQDMALVPQHPTTSLNPVLTIGQQVTESLREHLGLRGRRARAEALELLSSVGIPEAKRRLDAYPHELSGGMCQRAMIAIALACRPKLLIADEPTTALDVTIQAQILDLLRVQQRERNMALILITHDFGVAASCVERVAVMYAGRIVELAPTRVLFDDYRMRYSEALLEIIPRLDGPIQTRSNAIVGQPPNPLSLPTGCAFHPRCQHSVTRCATTTPALEQTAPGHLAACWNPVSTIERKRASA